jgi:hypothetical protein
MQRDSRAPEQRAVILEHYRLDPGSSLGRTLVAGVLLVSLGGLTAGSSMVAPMLGGVRAADGLHRAGEVTADGAPVAHEIAYWQIGAVAIGVAFILLGLARTIFALRSRLAADGYLALRMDGAAFCAGDEHAFVPWEEVERVRWDAEKQAVCFELHDGSCWTRAERFAGATGEELAARASEIRRKALFGLLKVRRLTEP